MQGSHLIIAINVEETKCRVSVGMGYPHSYQSNIFPICIIIHVHHIYFSIWLNFRHVTA